MVKEAVTQMIDIIIKCIKDSLGGNLYEKAIECVKVLRESCIKERES